MLSSRVHPAWSAVVHCHLLIYIPSYDWETINDGILTKMLTFQVGFNRSHLAIQMRTKIIMWKNETWQFLAQWCHETLDTVESNMTRSIRCYKDSIQIIRNELFNRAVDSILIPLVFVGPSTTRTNSDWLC